MINHDVEKIIKSGKQLINKMHEDKNCSNRSWEHCYSEFLKYKGKKLTDNSKDQLCLHLACYMASFGMYRASTKLQEKDYKVQVAAVEELMKNDYFDLWAVECKELISSDNKMDKLIILRDELKRIYCEIGVSHTDTLITKVLLGTLGCTPALDINFSSGFRGKKGAHMTFNVKNMREISKFYVNNNDELEELRKDASTKKLLYPQMRVLDLCFYGQGEGINLV